VRRDGARVRCFTRNGHDWADRFPAIVEAAALLNASSFLIDGEAVIARDDGTPDFRALRGRRRGHEAVLYAFDLIEHDSDDLRDLPLIERKRRLAKLIGRAKRRAIRFNEHLTGDGPTVFEHVCRMGLEGIVSKRTDAPYRSGPSKVWVKTKNPESAAVRREREEGVALASAHPSLHGSAQMENPTKASTATLRTIITIAATSMVDSRLAIRQLFRQSSDSVDLDHAAYGPLERFPAPGGCSLLGVYRISGGLLARSRRVQSSNEKGGGYVQAGRARQ
jgi:bifunctional non-homologous end joining protein LigD